jgi:hypothetical protein
MSPCRCSEAPGRRRDCSRSTPSGRGFDAVLPCRAAAIRQTLTYTAGIIGRHRKQIGSPWPKLNPGQQALLVLAYLRKDKTSADLPAGFGIGTATAWRYVTQTVGLLAARSPKLRTALRDAKQAGHAHVVIDGTLIPIDRAAADRPFYSGKHRRHGMSLQIIATLDGDIVWVSGPLPGAIHDLTTARIWAFCASWPPPAWSYSPARGTTAPGTTSAPPTGAETSQPPRKPPAGPHQGAQSR